MLTRLLSVMGSDARQIGLSYLACPMPMPSLFSRQQVFVATMLQYKLCQMDMCAFGWGGRNAPYQRAGVVEGREDANSRGWDIPANEERHAHAWSAHAHNVNATPCQQVPGHVTGKFSAFLLTACPQCGKRGRR